MNLKELSYVQKNSFIWLNVYEVLGKAEKNSDRKQIDPLSKKIHHHVF